jgi:energy-coupling factor transporter ATP-binding protein EcfA2
VGPAPNGSAPTAKPTLVSLRQITKSFPGVLANDQVDFDVQAGEIHALLGENGAGKTTLMNILYGLYRPDSGEIWIKGKKSPYPFPPRRHPAWDRHGPPALQARSPPYRCGKRGPRSSGHEFLGAQPKAIARKSSGALRTLRPSRGPGSPHLGAFRRREQQRVEILKALFAGRRSSSSMSPQASSPPKRPFRSSSKSFPAYEGGGPRDHLHFPQTGRGPC